MSEKKGSEPAFVNHCTNPDCKCNAGNGLTYRQYLAAHAPKETPSWFVELWISNHHIKAQATNPVGITTGDSQVIAREASREWPWYWADMVLEAETK